MLVNRYQGVRKGLSTCVRPQRQLADEETLFDEVLEVCLADALAQGVHYALAGFPRAAGHDLG